MIFWHTESRPQDMPYSRDIQGAAPSFKHSFLYVLNRGRFFFCSPAAHEPADCSTHRSQMYVYMCIHDDCGRCDHDGGKPSRTVTFDRRQPERRRKTFLFMIETVEIGPVYTFSVPAGVKQKRNAQVGAPYRRVACAVLAVR